MSEKIIKDQEETKEETKIGSEEIVKNGETKTGNIRFRHGSHGVF